MTNFAPHYRLTLSGDIGTATAPVEHFSFGVCLALAMTSDSTDGALGGSAGPLDLGMDDTQINDIFTDCQNFFGRSDTGISAAAKLKQVKLARIQANGKYDVDPKIWTGSVPGGRSSANIYPPQISLAVSLVTATRGPSGKGRFYLPMPNWTLDSNTMEIASGDRDLCQASVVQWLNDLNNEPGTDILGLGVVVASTKGHNHRVNGVRVGRVFDTIRSRRRSLVENYGPVTNLA